MIRRTVKALSKTNNMLILSEAEVRQCFPVRAAIECNRKALSSLRKDGHGGAIVPTRIGLPYNPSLCHGDVSSAPSTDWSLFKPAAYYSPNGSDQSSRGSENREREASDDIIMGMKVVSVRANNPSIGKPTVPATVMLLDPESGEVSAIMAATYLTAARTAAGSALATELAFRNNPQKMKDSLTLVVFGAGLQAELHIKSIQHVVKLKEVIIVNRSLERAQKLKESLLQSETNENCWDVPINISTMLLSNKKGVQNAVQEADVIVTATNTCVPLFSGEWVKPGCHINGVGSFTPQMKEVDDTLVQRCEVLIDTSEALDVGDLSYLKSTDERKVSNNIGLIGDALVGTVTFGTLRDDPTNQMDCTFYKSVGTAIQDVVSAQYVSNMASTMNGVGINVEM
eukprot:CCRYP_012161-RA/>CCRYP_012161-RA protein AED:0.30 eAED:0.30 QI:77/1/1/1/0.16/0.14/7/4235/397